MSFIYTRWWKLLAVALIAYTIAGGLLFPVPELPIIYQSIRNLYFHVPMWFSMIFLLGISVYHSMKYLRSPQEKHDLVSVECVNTSLLFGALGLITGMVWANYTWGEPWSNDPKQNSAAIAFLIYSAYVILRNAIEEEQKRAKVSAVYSIFAFPIMLTLIFILPRMTDSLHPGNGGNPAFGKYDQDNIMRLVFWPACIAWILIGIWVASLRFRIRILEKINDQPKHT